MNPMRPEEAPERVPIETVAPPAAADIAYERCASCGHRAFVLVMTAGGPLAFCAHHFEQNASALALVSVVIHDIRDQLVPAIRAPD